MANPEHLKILEEGLADWNTWRKHNPQIAPDLSGADVSWRDLSKSNLSHAFLGNAYLNFTNLHAVNFCEARLAGAHFSGATLSWADLRRADLRGAVLMGANLTGAKLCDAKMQRSVLNGANFYAADLRESDLSGAQLLSTVFDMNDLSCVRGLDTVAHAGPSTIGIGTIYKSKGNIPEVFLRGAGVPEDLIVYMRSLVGKAIDFYSCFISYSSKDDAFAQRLYADLQAKNVRCWKFDENAKWGEPVWGEIDTAIRHYDKIVVICSKDSLQSPPVIREIERALQKEDRERRNVLFPIRIDDYLFDEWDHPRKADVVSKAIGDFRGWKNLATYSQAFPRLLDALNRPQQAFKTG
jgi:hypothetical protein